MMFSWKDYGSEGRATAAMRQDSSFALISVATVKRSLNVRKKIISLNFQTRITENIFIFSLGFDKVLHAVPNCKHLSFKNIFSNSSL